MKKSQKLLLAVNIVVISALFVLNYFYQSNDFVFALKCVCSTLFASLGIINLIYALVNKADNKKFHIGMAAGVVFGFLGDVLIEYDFIVGAAMFAIGHICFVVAYCLIQKMQKLDYIISGALFLVGVWFFTLCPWISFETEMLRVVAIVYTLILSTMLGKAVGNLVREKTTVNKTIALASALFFFSDTMLALDCFSDLFSWTYNACMGTYYPSLCLLVLSMCLKSITDSRES
jgi:uncharacterized membrane protein YhhN